MNDFITVQTLKSQLGGIQTKLNFETVEPFVKTSLRWFRKMVGVDMLEYLEELREGTPADEERELLELAQACICWHSYDLAFPHLKVRVGDLGMTKSNPNNTISVTKWEYIDSREANTQMLDLALEDFFTSLEHLRPDAWKDSEAYKNRQSVFIRSASELARYVPAMGRNARFFDQLVTYVERAETLYLRPTITDSVFDGLKDKWKVSGSMTLTIAEATLLNELLPALAHLAVYEAFPYLKLNISLNGVSEQRSKDGLIEQVAPGAGVRDSLRVQLWQDASIYLGRAKNYLDKTATAELFSSYYNAQKGHTAELTDFTNSSLIIL